ncbi:MAG TPA: LLM class flavin-dependent oxidoreductase [Anaerolineae bacterium]|nr:LLM class flavin-dependent oxidoreductase [Anaerolineae bacterium]
MPAWGVIFHPKFPPETLANYARRAESGGFDELWLWDDCFLPGAFTSAAIALSATQKLKVGIGLMPATVYNPLFTAMEITTLARAFPDRFMPGFGHGVGLWMTQIGAAPKSSLKALEETVSAIRRLLHGDLVTTHGTQVNLDRVQMQTTPAKVPPLYVGAMRDKSLRLAGRVGDGTILTGMSSPAYARWAREQIRAGMPEVARTDHRVVVYLDVKVNRDGEVARAAMRRALAERLPWADVQLNALGIAAEVDAFVQTHGVAGVAQHMPDDWLDAFSAAGTPDQVTEIIQRLSEASADSIVFQPLNGDPDCLDEYIHGLMPQLKSVLSMAETGGIVSQEAYT